MKEGFKSFASAVFLFCSALLKTDGANLHHFHAMVLHFPLSFWVNTSRTTHQSPRRQSCPQVNTASLCTWWKFWNKQVFKVLNEMPIKIKWPLSRSGWAHTLMERIPLSSQCKENDLQGYYSCAQNLPQPPPHPGPAQVAFKMSSETVLNGFRVGGNWRDSGFPR